MPNKIVAIGGTNSSSDATFASLQALAPNVIRIGGSDRFEASRNVVAYAFGSTSADSAHVVTGIDFPDALGGSQRCSGVAGQRHKPDC